ncbi:type II toxin-antitoxin system HigB family toxin [Tardiphaga alba]|uniref:Type II toxin-antitoxin system HigB family toxin n=1 Tax=Tardiphaga alba TaxID=340268 RepID=A0ABX8AEH7_9BRAD|nr:type II toxin-antitoxin system HigB family toxin [Tardiphaga alba]QUS41029.1 type II toxin-antitoxin system HigB family toxin [Tardiphaga alba]
MRVISNSALVAFSGKHPAAGILLQVWRKIIASRAFANFSELKTTFNTVDRVGAFYVFDIGGNKFRIVASIHFDKQRLYVRHVFTHKEYDSWKP